MRLLLLTLVVCSVAVTLGNGLDIRTISIDDLLRENPSLKAELKKKIDARKNDGPTSVPATASAPATTTTTTTTTPTPQADTPPSTTPESTTKANKQSGRRRRPGGAARRRLRVSNNQAEEAPIQNGRQFPQ
ncbi:mucin-2-like [Penaeus japonicus]|uniref:mucin-2-like n=1 Tax=Penaeus japonicus TaxID=27405 RepID=UPI001C71131B|nr:mucin-2-like [Penaeus japonicus]